MNIIKKRINKHYHPKNKNWYWHLIIDGILLIIMIILITVNIFISTNDSGNVLGTQNDNTIIIPDNNSTPQDENTATTTDDQINEPSNEESIVIKATNIELKSSAKYYLEGEQLGVGPIPPIAGETTKYWIFISIENFNHDLENILVSATIPENVSLTGKTSVTRGENILLDENSKKLLGK